MKVLPTSQTNEVSTLQRQKEELKAVEEKKAAERAQQEKAQKEATLKGEKENSSSAVRSEGIGGKIDITG